MGQSVVVTREYPAPAIDVYRAWTEPVIMRRWLAAVVEADVRVGGRYRLENRAEDGVVHAFAGEYLAIEYARRLVLTLGMDGSAVGDAHVSAASGRETVELSFESVTPTVTRLTLTNRWDHTLPDDDLDGVREGWSAWLEMASGLFEPEGARPA